MIIFGLIFMWGLIIMFLISLLLICTLLIWGIISYIRFIKKKHSENKKVAIWHYILLTLLIIVSIFMTYELATNILGTFQLPTAIKEGIFTP